MAKNKKNGFTLIELIATVVLIAVLATIILINMTGIKSNEDNSKSERFKKNIEEAACTYIDMSDNVSLRNSCKNNYNGCSVSLRKITGIDSNSVPLIDPEDIDPDTNEKVRNEVDCITVLVKWNNVGGYKEKSCVMQRGNGCK